VILFPIHFQMLSVKNLLAKIHQDAFILLFKASQTSPLPIKIPSPNLTEVIKILLTSVFSGEHSLYTRKFEYSQPERPPPNRQWHETQEHRMRAYLPAYLPRTLYPSVSTKNTVSERIYQEQVVSERIHQEHRIRAYLPRTSCIRAYLPATSTIWFSFSSSMAAGLSTSSIIGLSSRGSVLITGRGKPCTHTIQHGNHFN